MLPLPDEPEPDMPSSTYGLSSLWIPDTLMPSQMAHKRKLLPEERLMLAVLEDAIDCATGRIATHPGVAGEAMKWFMSPSQEWPFAFERIVLHFGWSASAIQRRVNELSTARTQAHRRTAG